MLPRKSLPVSRFSSVRPFLLGLTVFCALTAAPAVADSPDAELKRLQSELDMASSRTANFTSQLDNLSDEIKQLKGKLVLAAKVLTSLDRNLVDVEKRLEDIRQVEEDTLADLAKRNVELAGTLSALANLSRQPEGTLMGNPTGLVDGLRTSSLLQSIVPQLKKDADALGKQLESLMELRQQYTAERQQFSALRDQRIKEQETLDGLLAAKNKAQKEIAGARKSEQARLKALSSNVRDMAALITRLEQEKARKQALEKQRLQQQIARQKEEQEKLAKAAKEAENSRKTAAIAPPSAEKNGEEPLILTEKVEEAPQNPQKVAAANFARTFFEAKGTLPLPVGGRIISNYNESRKTGQQKGIVIESRPEAAVISPFDGQIAFAGPFRHYGLLLIIDHGDGFHTLLAGLGSIEGSVGQLLLAGEPVGQMKNSGNEKPKLYMELRRKGTPINPIPWLLAENRKVSG